MHRFSVTLLTLFTVSALTGCDEESFEGEAMLELEDEDAHALPELASPGEDEGPVRAPPSEPIPDPVATDQFATDIEPQEGYWGGWQPIVAVKSGMCLDSGGDTAGAWVRQSYCHFSQRQQWELLTNVVDNSFRIRNQRSGLCIDSVYGYLSMQPCGGWNTQKWVIHDPSTPGLVSFESVADGDCWGVVGGSIDPTWVHGSYTCLDTTSQQFVVVVPDNSYACGV